LYIIVRNDLEFGQQASQICHALTNFALEHKEVFERWNKVSNYICLLKTDDEYSLIVLMNKATEQNILHSCFTEPDYGNSLTAICLEPGDITRTLVKDLKLAFK